MNIQDQLIDTLKMAYRKHVQMDDSIGWDELSDKLCDALCNAIGDDAFIALENGESIFVKDADSSDSNPDDCIVCGGSSANPDCWMCCDLPHFSGDSQ